MPEDKPKPNILFRLAAEGMVPILGAAAGGAANVVVGDHAGPVVGMAVEKGVEKAINIFGRGIVARWQEWIKHQPVAAVDAAVEELVELTPAVAREQARTILLELAPQADLAAVDRAVEYLTAVPRAVNRALVPDPARGGCRSLPPSISLEDERSLLQLLPEDVPPYPSATDLAGTPYRLVELLGSGGFGAVYRATSPSLQHLPLAIKFCLDRSLVPTLHQERSNLERLMRAGGRGAGHVVRLYGYDLDHPTPYLVYEYVAGGDLTHHLAVRRATLGRLPDAAEVLGWVAQLVDGLAFAHRAGVVHRDLKPANVLVDDGKLKLADFGIGGATATRAAAAARSRVGPSTMDYLSLADQASLFRGAGTPLYMSPEQRKGANPDPRHDLYALGVVWYQLLAGDVSKELHHGWAKELRVRFGVPPEHIALLERCVGWFDDRPANAAELLPLLREAAGVQTASTFQVPITDENSSRQEPRPTLAAETTATAAAATVLPGVGDSPRRTLAASLVNRLHEAHSEYERLRRWSPTRPAIRGVLFSIAFLFMLVCLIAYGNAISAQKSPEYPDMLSMQRYQVGVMGATFMALPGAVLFALIYYAVAWARMDRARGSAKEQIIQLGAELSDAFPELVADIGGVIALRNPECVTLLRDRFAPPAPLVIVPRSAASQSRRPILGSQLARLEKMHADLAALAGWPLWETIVWGFFPGILLGWLAGELLFDLRHQYAQFPAAFGYYGNDWVANIFGGIVGVAVWTGYVALIRFAVRPQTAVLRAALNDQIAELARDFPFEVEAAGGRAALKDYGVVRRARDDLAIPTSPPAPTAELTPEQVAADPARRALAAARLTDLIRRKDQTDGNLDASWLALIGLWVIVVVPAAFVVFFGTRMFDDTWSKTLSVIVSVTIGLFAAWLWWEAVAAWRQSLRRKWAAEVDEFTAEYPRLVAAWGGRGAFNNPETRVALLRSLDPTTKAGKGFLKRWFGG
ncbi:serine/threonine-protein kinase [Fimbriiglobus ruber]|uniref:Serine/threonine protein kinase n=1 Tax=Fimbriiglobus ruber TaxID=1908690 RepID=A0A225DWC8_9BACT|nr:serine/threonine-protein kinase [Fimbriiglobus ruber]OWK43864.1 Serine/threonine protein kinase [Fimbriiglobus ruber]